MFLARLDRYILAHCITVFCAVVAIIMSLMVLEHIPRLFELSRFSGRPLAIIGETVVGLLPEYAGIGVLVGLYLAFALAIRKLALRGELDVIEAMGIAPARWTRMIALMTAFGAAFLLVNQGWLVPAGERQLITIGDQMERGDYGLRLGVNEFHDLGEGAVLFFASSNADKGEIGGIYMRADNRVYTASRGTVFYDQQGSYAIRMFDGQAIDSAQDRSTHFDEMLMQPSEVRKRKKEQAKAYNKPLDQLWESHQVKDRSAFIGRLLWSVLGVLCPFLAFFCARPPMRSTSAIGLLFGLALLIGLLKSISLVESGISGIPLVDGLGVLAVWFALLFGLYRWQESAGPGAFDQWAMGLVKKLRA